ncbi:MAG: response regulator [Candidatus Magnetominusculus sp. LBB02]|nr:response regulator [Candidatus Magnetominusculus sp. LBB02]
MYKVLLISSDYSTLIALKSFMESNSYSVMEALSNTSPFDSFKRYLPDAVILDLILSDGCFEALRQIRQVSRGVPVILLVNYSDENIAANSMNKETYDYFVKPVDIDRLLFVLNRGIALNKTKQSVNAMLRWHLGNSDAMQEAIGKIEEAVGCSYAVNVHGEDGTGKSQVARLIHNCSAGAEAPFIVVDAKAVLKENTAMSARVNKLFRQAIGGTIYLRGLHNNISPAAAASLASAAADMQQDVRIIASFPVNLRDIERQTKASLYGKWIEISLPPLAQRIEDIEFLTSRFIAELSDELNSGVRGITNDAKKILLNYRWPGNVRELKTAVRRAVTDSDGVLLRGEHFSFLQPDKLSIPLMSLKKVKARAVQEIERAAIIKTLQQEGCRAAAASKLNISRKTLWKKMKEYDIEHGNPLKKEKPKAAKGKQRMAASEPLESAAWGQTLAADVLDIGEETLLEKIEDIDIGDLE